MKRFSEQLNKKSKTVKLQAAEKNELRERLVSYMEYHPLPAKMRAEKKSKRTIYDTLGTDAFTTVSIPFATLFKSSAVAAAVVLAVVPFMAEEAVPGDPLYAIKVQTEEIRSTLTFDGYQKVEWETERLNRRIAEARLLASEGRLTEEVEAEVAEAVREHTENAKREIAEMQTEDADDAALASIALDTTLEVQATTYHKEELAAAGKTNTPTQTNLIAAVIDKSLQDSVSPSATATLPKYDKLLARIEQNTTRIYELLTTLQKKAPDTDFANVTRRIEDLERSLQAATKVVETDEIEARRQLVGVLQRTQKLIVYMTELEVIKTVDIETLVPVVLTDLEEESQAAAIKAEIVEKTAQIGSALERVEDEDVQAKVEFALVAVTEQVENLASSTTEFAAFKVQAAAVLVMIDDVLLLLEQHGAPLVPVEVETATSTEGTATSTEALIIDEMEVPVETGATSTEAVEIERETKASSTDSVTEESTEEADSNSENEAAVTEDGADQSESAEEVPTPVETQSTTSTAVVDSQ